MPCDHGLAEDGDAVVHVALILAVDLWEEREITSLCSVDAYVQAGSARCKVAWLAHTCGSSPPVSPRRQE